MLRRHGFPQVLEMAQQLVRNLQAGGHCTDVDINNVTMRYAMDVTGLVGFAKDFGTCKAFNDAGTDEIFDLLREGKIFQVFNLNSFLSAPEWVGKLYLGMVLQQAETEGSRAFVLSQVIDSLT